MDDLNQETQTQELDSSNEQEQSLDFEMDKSVFDELGIDPSKYGVNDEGENEQNDEGQENTEETQETSLLDSINALNFIHNDSPLKIESEEQLKELVQKGYDYTAKTQNLSEERKRWDAEKSQAETELNAAIEAFNQTQEQLSAQINELQQWQYTFNVLKSEAPDVFAEVQTAFERTQNNLRNPIIENQIKAMQQQFQAAMKEVESQKHKVVVDEFQREWSASASTIQALKDLGISVDEAKVKNEWKETGLPVKKAIGSLYFEEIAKATASKAKVQATAKKVTAKPVATGNAARTGKVEKQVKNTGDYLAMAQELFNKMK